jgi:hypothetical protein
MESLKQQEESKKSVTDSLQHNQPEEQENTEYLE